ncbi:MAG: hypothetical protein HY855_17680 [Burkholderiales bacterium]|nr:hypothetical protein [Burkholderiales bacterium]
MRVLRCLLTSLALIALLHPAWSWAQNQNSVGIGATKMQFYNCRSVSTGDIGGVASIAVFPEVLNKNTFGVSSQTDPLNEFKLSCAVELRKFRCSKEMIAALGEVYSNIAQNQVGAGALPNLPASSSIRDPVVAGTVAGGVIGLYKGAQVGHPILGALGGAYVGNKAGKFIGEAAGTWAPAGSCAYRQIQLARMAGKLQTPQSALLVPLPIDAASAVSVLTENVAAGHLTQQEAEELQKEVLLLTSRLSQILVVINS